MDHAVLVSFAFVFLSLRSSVLSCGGITHIEISYRALNNFEDIKNNTSYDTIIRQNPGALEAGSSYPDAFYSKMCFKGIFHNVSEDTHWTRFFQTGINYIHRYYPKPWDVRTQMLVAFLMGSLSHAVADISWHSLGLDQGFIQAMSRTNYHHEYEQAHSDADLGGDVLNLFQLNLTYGNIFGEWYVPVHDLKPIYDEYYGKQVINESIIETCTRLLYMSKVAEKLFVKKYFPISAKASPFLVDELYEYFLGGVEDMATWTRRIWKQASALFENPATPCDLPHNPLCIRCGDSRSEWIGPKSCHEKHPTRRDFLYREPDLFDLTLDHVEVVREERGVWFRPAPLLKEKIAAFESHSKALHFESERKKSVSDEEMKDKPIPGLPAAVFSVGSSYAKLGRAYAVADLDEDGNEDVIIGAPGYYSRSRQQSGMVFILYGTDFGLNVSDTDLARAADVKIPGPENEHGAHTQFGSSLAIFDFDQDGKLDIAIGAPSYGSENLTYGGRVYVFSVIERNKFSLRGEVDCKEKYCTLGSTLSTGDINSDGFHDLLIASPYAPAGGEQRGFVGTLKANKNYKGKRSLKFTMSVEDGILTGNQDYSWLGKSVSVKNFGDHGNFVAVGEPSFRKCVWQNCSFDVGDVQAIGQVHILKINGENLVPYREMRGEQFFDMFGASVAMGNPYGESTNILAVAGTGTSVKAHVSHFPVDFAQVGSVFLYNISNFYQYPIATFNGDRRFGRFGAQLKFADLNRDGFDDLIIGAPLRTKDFTEELHGAQQGMVFVYMGGSRFPRGEVTTNCGVAHVIEPCPGEKASNVLAMDEQKARFGSQIAVVRTKKKVNLLVTAEHSSLGARLSGAVAVFDF